MRIAIIGTRGIPANYGGVETPAEQLSLRLAERGHEVTVYCRSAYASHPNGHVYRGVKLAVLPTIRHKYFDTVIHSLVSTLHALPKRFDVILVCNAANTLVTFMPRLFGTPVAVNVDGLERKRKKWNALGRAWYRLSERLSTFLPSAIITDAETIKTYYSERYGKTSTFIPYGAETRVEEGTEALDRFGLHPKGYMLYVSRLEPENNATPFTKVHRIYAPTVPFEKLSRTGAFTLPRRQLGCPTGKSARFSFKPPPSWTRTAT